MVQRIGGGNPLSESPAALADLGEAAANLAPLVHSHGVGEVLGFDAAAAEAARAAVADAFPTWTQSGHVEVDFDNAAASGTYDTYLFAGRVFDPGIYLLVLDMRKSSRATNLTLTSTYRYFNKYNTSIASLVSMGQGVGRHHRAAFCDGARVRRIRRSVHEHNQRQQQLGYRGRPGSLIHKIGLTAVLAYPTAQGAYGRPFSLRHTK